MPLNDSEVTDVVSHIRDSFRVRPNHDPVYIDVSDHLARVRAPQHQVIFGRRGSGKSCLLVHFHRNAAPADNLLSIYIDADVIKRLTYPDLLIRLLLSILKEVARPRGIGERLLRLVRPATALDGHIRDLETLLRSADELAVVEEKREGSERSKSAQASVPGFGASMGSTDTAGRTRTSAFSEQKLETLERHLDDYKKAMQDLLASRKFKHATIIVDDFYLFPTSVQPDALDYLHRLVRGTSFYLKIGTIRHRTTLSRIDDGQMIGVEPTQDVEEISLDRTFEDLPATESYLTDMLDSMAASRGVARFSDRYVSAEGRRALTLASGGVPRDYLNTVVEGIAEARRLNTARWLTPTTVYKGAGRVSYQTKLSNLRTDSGDEAGALERVFQDLLQFCLREKKKTAFLVPQDEVLKNGMEHEYIKQLMDFKLIHVIEPDTSAASGRAGRYEAYTLDFALFMEPRLRGIEHVEFWKVDSQRRKQGVREAPVYSLVRARDAAARATAGRTEAVISQIEADTGTEDARDGEQ